MKWTVRCVRCLPEALEESSGGDGKRFIVEGLRPILSRPRHSASYGRLVVRVKKILVLFRVVNLE